MNRKQVLEIATITVTADRQATHGKPEDTFSDIAAYWSIYTGKLINPHDVAAMLAMLKIARIGQNPQHDDNWIDLAGYAACGAELVPMCADPELGEC